MGHDSSAVTASAAAAAGLVRRAQHHMTAPPCPALPAWLQVVLLDEMLNKMFCKTVGSGPAPPALANQARQVRSAPVVPDYDDDEEEEAPRARRR